MVTYFVKDIKLIVMERIWLVNKFVCFAQRHVGDVAVCINSNKLITKRYNYVLM